MWSDQHSNRLNEMNAANNSNALRQQGYHGLIRAKTTMSSDKSFSSASPTKVVVPVKYLSLPEEG